MSAALTKKRKAGQQPVAQERLNAIGIDAVCADLADGRTMTEIAIAAGVAFGSLHTWLDADPERSARAREARRRTARLWDEKATAKIEAATDTFQLAKAKEMAHHYRWRASKIAPREYGDKLAVGGDDEMGPVKLLRVVREIVRPEKLGE